MSIQSSGANISEIRLKVTIFPQPFICRYDYSGYGASTGKVSYSSINTT